MWWTSRHVTFVLFSSQHRSDDGRHRVHDHRLDGAASDRHLAHAPAHHSQPAACLGEFCYHRTVKNQPAAACRPGERTDSRAERRHQTSGRRGSSEALPSAETHVVHKHTKPDLSATLKAKQQKMPATLARSRRVQLVHLLVSFAAFSFQHLQQASGSQPPGRVHKHHALFQMERDVHGGGKTHLRRPLKIYRSC